MRYAQIKNGKVENIIICDENSPLDLLGQGYDYFVRVDELETQPDIGFSYDGANFSAPVVIEELEDLSSRQIRLGLLAIGISLDAIETILNGLPEPVKSEALIAWEFSNFFERNNDLVDEVGAMLGLTSDQIDDLWRLSITL